MHYVVPRDRSSCTPSLALSRCRNSSQLCGVYVSDFYSKIPRGPTGASSTNALTCTRAPYLMPIFAIAHDLHGHSRGASVVLLVAVAQHHAAGGTTPIVQARA